MSKTTESTGALTFFQDRFGLDEHSLTRTLDTALERQVDYAEFYVRPWRINGWSRRTVGSAQIWSLALKLFQ